MMPPGCQLGPHATPVAMKGTFTGLRLCRCCGSGEPNLLELLSWMDEPLPEDYKGSSVVQKSEDLHGFTMIYHPTVDEKIM